MLESCGLSEHCDFATEVSVSDGEGGRLRPDVVVRVPGGQSLVIDAKVSLNAYQDAFGAVDEAERASHLARMPRRSAPTSTRSATRPIGRSSTMRPTMS